MAFAKTQTVTKVRADGKSYKSIQVITTPITRSIPSDLKPSAMQFIYADGSAVIAKLTDECIATGTVQSRTTKVNDSIAAAPKARATKSRSLTADLKQAIDELILMQGKGTAIEPINELLLPMLFAGVNHGSGNALPTFTPGAYTEPAREYLQSRLMRSVRYQVFRTIAGARNQSAEGQRAKKALEMAEKALTRVTTRKKNRQSIAGGVTALTDAALALANERLAKADARCSEALGRHNTDNLVNIDTEDICDDALGEVLCRFAVGDFNAERSFLSNAKRVVHKSVQAYLRRTRFDTSLSDWTADGSAAESEDVPIWNLSQEAYEAEVRTEPQRLHDLQEAFHRAAKRADLPKQSVQRLERFITLAFYENAEAAYSTEPKERVKKSRDLAFLRAIAETDAELRDTLAVTL